MRSLLERFEDKFIPEPNSGCWLWMGAITRGGYGHIRKRVNNVNKMTRAHRVSYELYKGPIPEGLQVLHTCDNPICVNPNHLFLGTNQDNVDDKVSKDRHSFGRSSNHMWLSKELADKIKSVYLNSKLSMKAVASMFNTSAPQVCRIVKNKIWR